MTLPSSRPLYALLLTALCCTVLGFNVDVKNCIIHRGPQGSMFGFSVAQHKERGRSWLLIGAPEAQTSQPGVEKGGAVFRCGTARNDDCEEIPFDTRGNNNSTKLNQMDSKSRQWFGATVKSSGDNGVILACAPRYVYFTNSGNLREPVGTCYTTRDFDDYSEYSPCRTRNRGYNKQGYCQAGFGASVSKDGKRLFVGAVGSWYWQGQLYSVNSSARLPYIPAKQYITDSIDEGQFYSQNLYSRPDVLSTLEGPLTEDDSYLGYSVAVGNFGFGSDSSSAVGMPRGGGLFGKVVLFSSNLVNLYNITGEQIGAYFGYSICVSDVDGDGLDDIIVGAPMYSDYTKNDGSYETGKVYVFLKKEGYKYYEQNTRTGFNSKSRFGLALSGLGDINRDGYGDFAVGAPYDGPDELGAVYIYHGTKMGVRQKYSQLIRSEDVSILGRPISTFGFSVSGGTDLDNNLYPDLIIGAYESDMAYFMKSRPVAQMNTSVYFKSDNKQISLERRECTTKDGTWVPCLFLGTCLQYTGIGIDDQLNIEMQLILDARKSKSPRMFFLMEENRNVLNHSLTLDKSSQSCKTFNVYLKNDIRDKLTPIEAELRYRIIEENRKFTRTLTPVLDLDNELFAVSRDSISIQKNCGGDNICIPNLRLIATPSTESFLLGSNENIKIDVIVQNEGEDSFETTFDMTVPPGVNYKKIERLDNNEKDIPVQCSAPSIMTNNTLHCDIGNPLPQDKNVQFRVVLEPYQTTETKARYEFNMAVNSTNPENLDSVSDNSKYLGIPLWVETDLIITGTSRPLDVHYDIVMEDSVNITDEKQIGPQVFHVYEIRNKGPSDILEAEAYIDWPLFTLAGEPLLYLLEMPETSGQVKCEAIEEINPLQINIDRNRKSYFESSGLISGSSGTNSISNSGSRDSSSKEVVLGTKTFEELTEEEKIRFLEIKKKNEEESKSQWSYESNEQKIKYQNSKSESGSSMEGGRAGSGKNEASGSSTINVNRRPTFNVGSNENGGVIHNEYSSSNSESTFVTENENVGGNHDVFGTSNMNGNRGPTFSTGSSENGGLIHNEYSNSKSESTLVTGVGIVNGGTSEVSGSTNTNINRGPKFTIGPYENGGVAHKEYDSRVTGSSGSSIYTESSQSGSSQENILSVGGQRVQGGSGSSSISSGVQGGIVYESSKGVYGAAHFDETESSSGSSSFNKDNILSGGSIAGSSHSENGGLSSQGSESYGNTAHFGNAGSDLHGGLWSTHSGSSVNVKGESNFNAGSETHEGTSSGSYSSSSNSGSGSRGWVSGSNQTPIYNRGQSNSNSWESSQTNYNSGGQLDIESQEAKWAQKNQGSVNNWNVNHDSSRGNSWNVNQGGAGGNNWNTNQGGAGVNNWNANQGGAGVNNWNANQHGSWNAGGGVGLQGGKNFTTFHKSENNHVVNTTWDGIGSPKTYETKQWRTNNNGYVRNGSSSHVQDGVLDYQEAINKMNYGGVTNVVSSIPGDDSDLSINVQQGSVVTERQNQGFRQTKIDETETVQKFRTVDGKLYKVNNADDWNALLSKDVSTKVYNAQDYEPQEYRKPPKNKISNHNSSTRPEDVDGKLKLYTRFKRDTQTKKCGSIRCVTVKCKIGPLSKDQQVWLNFRSRAWVNTLKKVSFNRQVTLSSTITAKVTKLPYIGKPDSKLAQVRSHEVFTEVIPRDLTVKPDIIPLWIVVLAAVAGTAILLLLVYLLYKCGFFKRNRPSSAPEKQPLTNRNGQAEHYQTGDEAL